MIPVVQVEFCVLPIIEANIKYDLIKRRWFEFWEV